MENTKATSILNDIMEKLSLVKKDEVKEVEVKDEVNLSEQVKEEETLSQELTELACQEEVKEELSTEEVVAEELQEEVPIIEEVSEERMVAIITHVKDIEKRTPSALKIKRGTTEKIEVLN